MYLSLFFVMPACESILVLSMGATLLSGQANCSPDSRSFVYKLILITRFYFHEFVHVAFHAWMNIYSQDWCCNLRGQSRRRKKETSERTLGRRSFFFLLIL